MAKKLHIEYTSYGSIKRCYEIDVPDPIIEDIKELKPEVNVKETVKPQRKRGVK